MPHQHHPHRCSECGALSHGWAGRCPACAAWNTLVQAPEPAPEGPGGRRGGGRAGTLKGAAGDQTAEAPAMLSEVDAARGAPVPTGIGELDRVLGGGLVPGSVTLLGGEPGIGKSTLLLQAVAHMAARGARCLLVCGEESPQQVRRRATRLGVAAGALWVLAETCLQRVVAAIDELHPDIVVVDSIQTVHDAELASSPGSIAQVSGCAQALVGMSKAAEVTTVLVGHVTKDGALAGPRVLEHVVDTVLCFEGERHHALRLLRASKHRFGPSGELGLFEMTDQGLSGVADPAHLFLGERRPDCAGSALFPALEGHRPLVVEVQALVVPCSSSLPRRSARGLDGGRVSLLLAVLQRRAGLSLGSADVYASAIGGVRVTEPGADLALCLALASAAADRPLRPDLVVCGEVGLTGEIRQVSQLRRRLAEAARLGYRHALVPPGGDAPGGAPAVIPVASLAEAVSRAGLPAGRPAAGGRGGRRMATVAGVPAGPRRAGTAAGVTAVLPVPPGPAGAAATPGSGPPAK